VTKRRFAVTWWVLVWLVGLTVTAGCQSNQPVAQSQIRTVQVETVKTGPLTLYEEYGGRLSPFEEVNVAATIGGRVEQVFFDTGQVVSKGQTLFTLKTEAQIVNQAQAAVDQAQLQFNYAQDLYTKTQVLFTSGAVSQQELDRVTKDYNSAQVQLESARNNLNLVSSPAGGSNLAVLAPISGTVAACNIKAGEMTSASVPAFTIIDPREVNLEIMVSDKKIGSLSKGQALTVKIDGREDVEIQGLVDMICPNVDPRTKLFTVKIVFPQPVQSMSPGMIARVLVPVESKADVQQVKNQAVVVEQGVTMVYTADNGVVKKKAVKTGIATADRTEIVDGLESGEQVIMEGQHLLQNGDQVKVVPVGEEPGQ